MTGGLPPEGIVVLDRGYVDDVMERLAPLGAVTGKSMFGGYGIWEDGDMFALVDRGSTLYFKVDDATRGRYAEAGGSQFMTMPYWSVPVEVLDDDDRFADWARDAIAVGHATAKRRRR